MSATWIDNNINSVHSLDDYMCLVLEYRVEELKELLEYLELTRSGLKASLIQRILNYAACNPLPRGFKDKIQTLYRHRHGLASFVDVFDHYQKLVTDRKNKKESKEASQSSKERRAQTRDPNKPQSSQQADSNDTEEPEMPISAATRRGAQFGRSGTAYDRHVRDNDYRSANSGGRHTTRPSGYGDGAPPQFLPTGRSERRESGGDREPPSRSAAATSFAASFAAAGSPLRAERSGAHSRSDGSQIPPDRPAGVAEPRTDNTTNESQGSTFRVRQRPRLPSLSTLDTDRPAPRDSSAATTADADSSLSRVNPSQSKDVHTAQSHAKRTNAEQTGGSSRHDALASRHGSALSPRPGGTAARYSYGRQPQQPDFSSPFSDGGSGSNSESGPPARVGARSRYFTVRQSEHRPDAESQQCDIRISPARTGEPTGSQAPQGNSASRSTEEGNDGFEGPYRVRQPRLSSRHQDQPEETSTNREYRAHRFEPGNHRFRASERITGRLIDRPFESAQLNLDEPRARASTHDADSLEPHTRPHVSLANAYASSIRTLRPSFDDDTRNRAETAPLASAETERTSYTDSLPLSISPPAQRISRGDDIDQTPQVPNHRPDSPSSTQSRADHGRISRGSRTRSGNHSNRSSGSFRNSTSRDEPMPTAPEQADSCSDPPVVYHESTVTSEFARPYGSQSDSRTLPEHRSIGRSLSREIRQPSPPPGTETHGSHDDEPYRVSSRGIPEPVPPAEEPFRPVTGTQPRFGGPPPRTDFSIRQSTFTADELSRERAKELARRLAEMHAASPDGDSSGGGASPHSATSSERDGAGQGLVIGSDVEFPGGTSSEGCSGTDNSSQVTPDATNLALRSNYDSVYRTARPNTFTRAVQTLEFFDGREMRDATEVGNLYRGHRPVGGGVMPSYTRSAAMNSLLAGGANLLLGGGISGGALERRKRGPLLDEREEPLPDPAPRKDVRPPDGKFKDKPLRCVVADLLQPTLINAFPNEDARTPAQNRNSVWSVQPEKLFTMTFSNPSPNLADLHKGSYDMSQTKESAYKVLLRFGHRSMQPTNLIDDFVPPGIHNITVNGVAVTHPTFSNNSRNVEIDITEKISCGDNEVKMKMTANLSMNYVVTIQYVQCYCLDDLLDTLKQRMLSYDQGLDEVMKKFYKPQQRSRQSDIGPAEEARISLICPIGCKRIVHPGRGKSCQHVYCFDAASYVLMNAQSNQWTCPICRRLLPFEDLLIDGFQHSVVEGLREDTSDIRSIVVKPSGSWQVEGDSNPGSGKQDSVVPMDTSNNSFGDQSVLCLN